MVSLIWQNDNPAFSQYYAALHIPDGSPEQQRAFNDLLQLTTSPANAAGIIQTFTWTDVRGLLPKLRCPTLVLHARKDAILPFEEGRMLAAMIPDARFVPLESRNHDILDTEPAWQQVVEAFNDFLPIERGAAVNGERLPLDDLTAREREILECVAQGHNNNKIARQLGISEKTVRNHVSTIFSKLGVENRVQAVVRAREAGFGHK